MLEEVNFFSGNVLKSGNNFYNLLRMIHFIYTLLVTVFLITCLYLIFFMYQKQINDLLAVEIPFSRLFFKIAVFSNLVLGVFCLCSLIIVRIVAEVKSEIVLRGNLSLRDDSRMKEFSALIAKADKIESGYSGLIGFWKILVSTGNIATAAFLLYFL